MTGYDWDDCWDEGAADHLPIPAIAAGVTQTLAPGPLVLLGVAITNSGIAATVTTFLDGSAGLVLAAPLGAGAGNTFSIPDRGVRIETELVITGGASGPVSGTAFVRYKNRPHGRQSSLPKSGPTTSPSPQGPLSRPPSRSTPVSPR